MLRGPRLIRAGRLLAAIPQVFGEPQPARDPLM
jgi:hypothetical protein